MAAQVSFEQGLVEKRVSGETLRATLARLLGVAKDDPEPKAISCYRLYLPEIDET